MLEERIRPSPRSPPRVTFSSFLLSVLLPDSWVKELRCVGRGDVAGYVVRSSLSLEARTVTRSRIGRGELVGVATHNCWLVTGGSY